MWVRNFNRIEDSGNYGKATKEKRFRYRGSRPHFSFTKKEKLNIPIIYGLTASFSFYILTTYRRHSRTVFALFFIGIQT